MSATCNAKALLWTILLAAGLSGCGNPSDKDPLAGTEFEGTWAGTMTRPDGATLNISFDLSLRNPMDDYSGFWRCTAGTIACFDSVGVLTGDFTGDSFTGSIDFQDSVGDICDTWNGTVTGDTISGVYACQTVVYRGEGTWSATRQ